MEKKAPFAVWKLISGIISIVMSAFIVYQSRLASILATIQNSGDKSGSVGMIVAVLILAGGIISIVTRYKGGEENVPIILIFTFAGAYAITNHGEFLDLIVWGAWCFVCAILAAVSLVAEN